MGTFRQDTRLGKMVPLMKTDDYNDKSVTTEKLADKAVTDKKVADNAIATSNIKDLSVTSQKIVNSSVTTEKLADNAVKSEKIAQGAVDSEQIQYDAIKNEHIDDGAITTDKLFDRCVQTDKLEDHAVTMEKLADGSVVNKKLAPDAVSATKIAGQAVLVSKIADEVWNKLKNEYLRLDGTNSMKGHLFLNGYTISGVRDIFQNDIELGAVISLSSSGEIILKTIEVDGSEEPYHRILADFQEGEVSFPDGKVSSNGYKTIDRTNIGLLVNDGSVGLAMTDSDIDGLFQQVFQTVIG